MVEYSSLGGMAQLVEHSLHMRGVTGSSPVVSTNNPTIGLFFYTTDSNGDSSPLRNVCATCDQDHTARD